MPLPQYIMDRFRGQAAHRTAAASSSDASREPHRTTIAGSITTFRSKFNFFEKETAVMSRFLHRILRSAKWTSVLFAFNIAVLSFIAIHGSPQSHPISASSLPKTFKITKELLEELPDVSPPYDAGGHRSLRVFMPADSPAMNLCKTVMSSIALGYPAPTMLNWHGDFNHPEWHFAGSHIAKLESLLAVLNELLDGRQDDEQAASEHDLILLVDGYDIWFQLPPAVLIQRYHQLNREADERLLKQWQAVGATGRGFPLHPPRQKIIVTPGKHCSPGPESGSYPHYEHWPQSPMREDLYGDDTDTILPLWFDPARKYKKLRPRCVNSGFIMGTAGALREAMQRAKEKIDNIERAGRQIWSDQALLGEVIGDQEMWRTWMRDVAASWDGTSSDMPKIRNSDIRQIGDATIAGERFEFGIGLDYNFTTIPPTCSAEEDAYFVQLDDRHAVKAESIKAGVPGDARIHDVPVELDQHSTLLEKNDPLYNTTWGTLPLFTDFYFGTVPVGIHHNAYIDNLKATRLRDWWPKTWFFPRLRELVTANLQETQMYRALATIPVPGEDGETETVYWRAVESMDGATQWDPRMGPEKFVKLSWGDVCQKGGEAWEEELFGDGKGPLV